LGSVILGHENEDSVMWLVSRFSCGG